MEIIIKQINKLDNKATQDILGWSIKRKVFVGLDRAS